MSSIEGHEPSECRVLRDSSPSGCRILRGQEPSGCWVLGGGGRSLVGVGY